MNKLRTRKILLQIEFHFNASSLIFNSFQFDRKYQNNHRQRRDIPSGLNAYAKATSFVYAVVNHSFGSCPGVGNLLSWQKTNPGTEIHYVTSKNNHEEVRILTRAGWFDWLEKQPNHHGWWTPRTSGIVGSISEMIHFASQCCSDKLPSQLALVCLTTTFEINLRPLSAAQLCHESNLRCSDTLPWCFVLQTSFFLSSGYEFFVFSFFTHKVMNSLKSAEICIILS